MKINSDSVRIGDKVMHPVDGRFHEVKRIQQSYGHQDYVDFGFKDAPVLQVWKAGRVSVFL